jgi:hypothetical protein
MQKNDQANLSTDSPWVKKHYENCRPIQNP